MLTLESLAQLGITKEELLDRIAKQTATQLLNYESVDDEGRGWPVDTQFHKEMRELIQTMLRERVATHFREWVLPQLIELTEKMLLKKTSRFGEPKGKSMTLKEFMVQQVKNFMREPVDARGQPTTRGNGKPRLRQMLDENLQEVLKMESADVVAAANEMLAEELQSAIAERITAMASKFQIKVKT